MENIDLEVLGSRVENQAWSMQCTEFDQAVTPGQTLIAPSATPVASAR